MELKRKNWFNDVYLTFNDNLPNNFCDYFWGSLKTISICLFLITIGILATLSLLSPIMLIWDKFNEKSITSNFQIAGILIWVSIILVFIGYKLTEFFENRKYEYTKESVIKTWYKDFKNKHCTFIIWK